MSNYVSKNGPVIALEERENYILSVRQQDEKFCERMREMIQLGHETCSERIITEPGTQHPVFMDHRALPFSLNNSPAALCAQG